MRIIISTILTLCLTSTAFSFPESQEDRLRATISGLNNQSPKVRYASLIALGKIAGVENANFKFAAAKILGEIDNRIALLGNGTLTSSDHQEAHDLSERKINIISLLITKGNSLNHALRLYIRSQMGNGQIDGYLTAKIIKSLLLSKREGKDLVLVGSLVKFMNLAEELASRTESRAEVLQNLPLAAQLVISHTVIDADLIQRMSRILKRYGLPRAELTAYMGRLRGKTCGEALGET